MTQSKLAAGREEDMVRTAEQTKPARLALVAGLDVEPSAADRLCDLVDRIEELMDARSEIGREIEQIYEEAWNGGLSIRILRRVVLMRRRAKRGVSLRGDAGLTPPAAARASPIVEALEAEPDNDISHRRNMMNRMQTFALALLLAGLAGCSGLERADAVSADVGGAAAYGNAQVSSTYLNELRAENSN